MAQDPPPPGSAVAGRTVRRLLGTAGLVGAAMAVALLLLTAGTAGAQEEQDERDLRFDNGYCLGCHGQPGMETTLSSGEVLDLSFDVEAFERSVHGGFEIPCVLCHTDISEFPHEPITAADLREFAIQRADACKGCHLEQYEQALDNVHGEAMQAGHPEAAVCTDCHGAHDTFRPHQHSTEIPLTCRTCHTEIYDLYAESVHGEALLSGNRDVPTCTDCHGVHDVEGPAEDSPFHLFSPQICAECHADAELMADYGISTQVFETYVADFHGDTVILFEELAPDQETNKPVCIDCHGVHAIKATDDPSSSVERRNILQTCRRCHPDATENFSASWLGHYIPEPGKATIVWLVLWFYRLVIPVTIGGMLVFVIADTVRRRRAARRRARA